MTIIVERIALASIPVVSNGYTVASERDRFKDPRFENIAALIVKVTHRCNINCSYCYENITKGADMDIETFKQLAQTTLSSTRQKKVNFIFHGGEPTLLGNDWYIEAVGYAKTIAAQLSKQAVFSMQTNMVNVTDDQLKLYGDLGIKLGTSLDGPESLFESLRPQAHKALRNYRRAQSFGFKPGVIMTLNHANYDKMPIIINWLEHEVGVRSFKLNTMASVGTGLEIPPMTREQVFQGYRDVVDYMLATNGERLTEVQMATEIVRFAAKDVEHENSQSSLCNTLRCGAGNRVVGVNPYGQLLPCGRFRWDDERYFLGSLFTSNHDDIVGFSKGVEDFHNISKDNWVDCGNCSARNICRFGCQAFIVRSKSQLNIDCFPTKMRYEYFQANRQKILKLADRLKERSIPYPSLNTQHILNDYDDGVRVYNDAYSDYDDKYVDNQYDDYSDYHDYTDNTAYDDHDN